MKHKWTRAEKLLTVAVVLVTAVLGLLSIFAYERKTYLVYRENLTLTAVTVDGQDLTLSDLAFYIAYEENLVEEQARVYEMDQTLLYWNLRMKGKYVKQTAKQNVIGLAVHDAIFAKMAEEQKIELDEEEEKLCASKEADFWSDLTDEQKGRLGVEEQMIAHTMHQMALAQKAQQFYAIEQNKDYEDYELSGAAYEKLLKKHTYQINQKVWSRIDVGNITLDHGNTAALDMESVEKRIDGK